MQKIEIKNFAAITEAKIEIRQLLVFIGAQASGKSTIAKLIYFFKSIPDDFFNQFYQSERDYLDLEQDLNLPLRKKFYDFFGSTRHLRDFEITYFYTPDNFIRLTLNEKKALFPEFSPTFFDPIRNELKNFKINLKDVQEKIENSKEVYEQIALQNDRLDILKKISTLIRERFNHQQDDLLYVIAGRNATVSYSQMFKKYLFSDLKNKIEENSNREKVTTKEQTVDETLMLKFMERVDKIEGIFKKYGDFQGIMASRMTQDAAERQQLEMFFSLMNGILKGSYTHDTQGEKIMLDNGEYVYLHNASSGQQESIRILQDLFLVVLQKTKASRIVEEPESHLFPLAQKSMVELFALAINVQPENQLILTTHSPYILTAINNLLFAHRVIQKNADKTTAVNAVIAQSLHLAPRIVSIYALDESENGDICAENILNPNTGLIKQNFLDGVSDLLGAAFNELYNIHAQTFANNKR